MLSGNCWVSVANLVISYTDFNFLPEGVIISLSYNQLIEIYRDFKDNKICVALSNKADEQKIKYVKMIVDVSRGGANPFTFE